MSVSQSCLCIFLCNPYNITLYYLRSERKAEKMACHRSIISCSSNNESSKDTHGAYIVLLCLLLLVKDCESRCPQCLVDKLSTKLSTKHCGRAEVANCKGKNFHSHKISQSTYLCYKGMLIYIVCQCPNLVSIHFYAIPIILHFITCAHQCLGLWPGTCCRGECRIFIRSSLSPLLPHSYHSPPLSLPPSFLYLHSLSHPASLTSSLLSPSFLSITTTREELNVSLGDQVNITCAQGRYDNLLYLVSANQFYIAFCVNAWFT